MSNANFLGNHQNSPHAIVLDEYVPAQVDGMIPTHKNVPNQSERLEFRDDVVEELVVTSVKLILVELYARIGAILRIISVVQRRVGKEVGNQQKLEKS